MPSWCRRVRMPARADRPVESGPSTQYLVRASVFDTGMTTAREIDALRELVAPDLFAGFDPSSFPATSVPAFGLVAAAYLIGDPTGEAVSLAVRDALFERGLDVTDPEVLHEIGEPYGV